MEEKLAKPDSIAFRSFYFQKRRKKRKSSGTEQTPEIEFLTSNGSFFVDSNGSNYIVKEN